MPPVNGKRRAAVVTDSDEEAESSTRRVTRSPVKRQRVRRRHDDSETDEEDAEVEHRTSGRRSSRANGHQTRVPDSEEEDVDEDDGPLEEYGRPELDRGDDGYVAGSVVRIKLKNFMTYDFVEFHPGPHLNMILGPNGTGKSSIAAAIAIGLAFPPKIMGRAHDLKSYVKQGSEAAAIEIELKGKRGKRNSVVHREFNRVDDKSTFTLNGRPSTRRDIQKLVMEYGVQANNLCSFLPQDKVSDFAKMNPVTVLHETMRAAGDSRLTRWHAALVEKGKVTASFDDDIAKDIASRDQLQRQVDELAPDVENYEARAELEEQQLRKQAVKLGLEFERTKELSAAKKAEVTRAKLRLRAADARLLPLQELLKEMNTRKTKRERNYRKAIQGVEDIQTAIRDGREAVNKVESETKKIRDEMQRLKRDEKRRLEKIKDLKTKKEHYENVLKEPQEDVKDKIKEKQAERNAIRERLRPTEDKLTDLARKRDEMQTRVATLNREIDFRLKRQQDLSNAQNVRLQQAFRLDPSIQFACEWIKAHEMEFEAKVHLPPMVSVNVPNRNYAWQVEMCTNMSQRKTFICQNNHDYRKLLALNDRVVNMNGRQHKVSLHLAVVNVTDETVNPPRPCSTEALSRLGFDGFAIDFIEAEPAVIAYLCQAARLHQSALTLRSGSGLAADQVTAANITSWATKDDFTRAQRSSYGRRDWTYTSLPPVPAKAFNLIVDTEAINALVEEMANFRRERQDMEQPIKDLEDETQRCLRAKEELKADFERTAQELKELQREIQKYEVAHYQLDKLNTDISRLENTPSSETKKLELSEKLKALLRRRFNALKQLQAASDPAIARYDSLQLEGFGVRQAETNARAVEEVARAADERKEEYDEALKRRTDEWHQVKDVLRKKADELGKLVRGLDFQTLKEEMASTTLEQVEAELDEIEDKLAVSLNVTRDVIERHERLSEQLRRVVHAVEKQQRARDRAQAEVTAILDQFNPALDALVSETSKKFSEAFQKMGCSGEVRVNRVEGRYDEWGIEILVSYRDDEPLAVLTANRQSGGERSLATVTYLMSLTEMARTPFSLVDEINQGMDKRAERRVHNQMVQVTCSENAGQYFLITPKLLEGLHYNERMRILQVNNGVRLPDSADKTKRFGRLKSCLEKYRAAHGITA